jgi:phage tail protein X
MEYVRYITRQGDRWDLIAWRCYGTPYAFEQIIAANPTVPISTELDANLVLAIPVVQQAALDVALLPPWKR